MSRSNILFAILPLLLLLPTADGLAGDFEEESVLRDGQIYKLSVPAEGLYRLDAEFFSSLGGVDPSGIDPRLVSLYGNGGGMLPERVGDPYTDDLAEIPMYFAGNGDASFQADEYFLVFLQGPDHFVYDPSEDRFEGGANVYETVNYIFLRLDGPAGKRIATVDSPADYDNIFDTYVDFQRYEAEERNLLGSYVSTTGSGQRWFGDIFTNVRTQDLSHQFDFGGIVPGSPVIATMEMALRSSSSSSASLVLNGETASRTVSKVFVNNVESRYAQIASVTNEVTAPGPGGDFSLELSVSGSGTTFEAWLDYVQVRSEKYLSLDGTTLRFRQPEASMYAASGYRLQVPDGGGARVWRVTDPFSVEEVDPSQQGGTEIVFGTERGIMEEWVAWIPGADYPVPDIVGPVEPQNLHAIQDAEYVILYYADFREAALQLADHKSAHGGYDVLAIDVEHVFNEFGGGSTEPAAIRNFARMLSQRSERFRYLCLFGNGTYDYRGLNPDIPHTNFIPAYETPESLHPIEAFPSDDFFALLDEGEGGNIINGDLDIAIGRFPVISLEEAQAAVDKVITYETDPAAMGDWRTRFGFVADDEDSNQHLEQSLDLSATVGDYLPEVNQQKIFFDAYPQVPTVGDDRFPAAKEALNDNIFKGLLVINYYGHGGPRGWAQERVLERTDISGWKNHPRYPLFVTATCTFTGYDDPQIRSGGELAFINPKGGAIALVTTVRAVYSTSNARLTEAFFNRLLQKLDGEYLPVGEALRLAKNSGNIGNRENARKFSLIGDPGLQLAIPRYHVHTSHINGREVDAGRFDTVRALQSVEIRGFVADDDGRRLDDFQGEVTITLFDKLKTLQTLGQDEKSYVTPFEVRNNVLFKGKAEVADGEFQISMIIPRDIDYTFGTGRISYYATNGGLTDADGFYDELIIGGTNPGGISDSEGPDIRLYMNSEEFRDGGITGPHPTLLVKLEDDNGINVTGNSIGHDLTGILDGDQQNSFRMNEYYEAELGDYRKGTVRYPLYDLEDGEHHILVRAWDVSNNMSEAGIRFTVISDDKGVIRHTLNYPNPFKEHTRFRLEHNLPPQNLSVRLDIYDQLGKKVHSISKDIEADDYVITEMEWDGNGYGSASVSGGIYYYRVTIAGTDKEGREIEVKSDGSRMLLIR